MKYQFLEHTADIKFKAYGKNLEKVFENSAKALFKVLYKKKVKKKNKRGIKVKGKDLENLMYNFLEEFLVMFDSENFLPSSIKLKNFNEKKLEISAEVMGDDAKNYETSSHIKAITYNDMFVKKEGKKFVAQVVIDV